MQLIPSNDEILELLHRTGGLREGHFEYPDGLHCASYIQAALAMRRYEDAKFLSVGLSRVVRADSEIRAMLPELSIVAPATGGMPVAYGVCEALHAHQVYWAENTKSRDALHFRMYFEIEPGEKILLVDDTLRTGRRLTQLKKLVEDNGGEVVGIAVLIHDPSPRAVTFGSVPFFHLVKLESTYYSSGDVCELCKQGVPLTKVWV